jgi:hypothetical protein
MPVSTRWRERPDGTLECVNPISPAARAAINAVDRAREVTEREYKVILGKLLAGETPPADEVTRIVSALGKTSDDVAQDMELVEAQLADEAAARRVDDERADLEQQVAQEDSRIEKACSDQAKAAEKAKSLEAEILKAYESVAVKEKVLLAKARSAESAAAATIQQATDQRHLLQSRLQNMTGGGCHVERLRSVRFRRIHEAKQQESDRAMAPYRDTLDVLPADDVIRDAVSPKAPAGPPVSDIGGRGVRLGVLDGEEVRVGVGKLG